MSVYQRFYVKTSQPQEVEQMLIEALGGPGQLYKDDNGRYLRPIKVTLVDNSSIQPERTHCGTPIDSNVETGWYWLESIMDVDSIEASWAAWYFLMSPHVETVAEDNEISGDEVDAKANVIDLHSPPFGQTSPLFGPLAGENPLPESSGHREEPRLAPCSSPQGLFSSLLQFARRFR